MLKVPLACMQAWSAISARGSLDRKESISIQYVDKTRVPSLPSGLPGPACWVSAGRDAMV